MNSSLCKMNTLVQRLWSLAQAQEDGEVLSLAAICIGEKMCRLWPPKRVESSLVGATPITTRNRTAPRSQLNVASGKIDLSQENAAVMMSRTSSRCSRVRITTALVWHGSGNADTGQIKTGRISVNITTKYGEQKEYRFHATASDTDALQY